MKNRIFTIQVLDDKDYDALHEQFSNIKKEDLESSLGFADAEKGEAYVRKTNVAALDETTMQHELQELLAKTSEHEIDGIRWKKGGVARFIVPALLSLVPGVGPALAAASNVGMGQYAQARHPEQLGEPSLLSAATQAATGYFGGRALAGGVSGGIQGGTQAGAGLLSKAGGIISGVGKGAITGSAGLKSNILGNAPGTVGAPIQANPIYVTPGATMQEMLTPAQQAANQAGSAFGKVTSQLGSSGVAPVGSQILGSALKSGIASTLTPATQAGAQAGAGGAVTPPPAAQTIGQKLGTTLTKPETILSAGSLLASTAMKQPEFPEMPIDIEGIRTSLMSGQGVSPLAQQARTSLSQIMSKKPEELYPVGVDAYYNAALRQTRLAYKRAQEGLAARYNLIDPNYAQSGEYQELARRLDTELANVESDYTQTEEQRRFELARSTQYQAIRDSLNVTDADMQELLGFTRLTIEQAAEKYKVAVEDVTELRRALGGFGGQVLAGSILGQTNPQVGK